jgi:hypothetical protein
MCFLDIPALVIRMFFGKVGTGNTFLIAAPPAVNLTLYFLQTPTSRVSYVRIRGNFAVAYAAIRGMLFALSQEAGKDSDMRNVTTG